VGVELQRMSAVALATIALTRCRRDRRWGGGGGGGSRNWMWVSGKFVQILFFLEMAARGGKTTSAG
jgi:hypothetical protein